jgi:hypothetical protein
MVKLVVLVEVKDLELEDEESEDEEAMNKQ